MLLAFHWTDVGRNLDQHSPPRLPGQESRRRSFHHWSVSQTPGPGHDLVAKDRRNFFFPGFLLEVPTVDGPAIFNCNVFQVMHGEDGEACCLPIKQVPTECCLPRHQEILLVVAAMTRHPPDDRRPPHHGLLLLRPNRAVLSPEGNAISSWEHCASSWVGLLKSPSVSCTSSVKKELSTACRTALSTGPVQAVQLTVTKGPFFGDWHCGSWANISCWVPVSQQIIVTVKLGRGNCHFWLYGWNV